MKKLILYILFVSFGQLSFSQTDLTKEYNLMPWPEHIEGNDAIFRIDTSMTISINGHLDSKRVDNAAVNFLRRLSNRTGVFIDRGFPLKNQEASIEVSYDSISNLTVNDDESYTLKVQNDKIIIKAVTDVGALRALQTLLQLVSYDEIGYYFKGADIDDSPRFVWRGLMIDVARHFHPIEVLKRNLDAMASVKLNVFHWHLTDDQGFRVESKVYPKLHELASDGLYYTQDQIKDLVTYASNLGIRVIPEIDVPGHASAILTAYPELGSKEGYEYSIERHAGIFDPTLDPTNEETYVFLENLFTEVVALFPDRYFHIGGDENAGKHWNENEKITQFKKEHNLKNNHELQTYFNIRLEKTLNKLDKYLMGWDEIMTPNMPTTAVIHSWRGENEGLPKGGSLISAAKKGYQAVLSNGYYIDRMLSVKHHYSVDPIGNVKLTEDELKRVLGGEATMWSELVTPLTIDSRIWPRTAAIAERFWSPKNVNDIDNMLHRLKDVNHKLEELGIAHIKNRAVILRNISNHQNNSALETLTNLCEPLKVYSRNKGGIEYKSFSPFTLFADACVVDAIDAVPFNKAVSLLKAKNNKEDVSAVIYNSLKKWSTNYDILLPIIDAPNVKPLEPLSKNLSKISKLLLKIFDDEKLSQAEYNELNTTIDILNKPYLDVELAVIESLQELIKFCETNYPIK